MYSELTEQELEEKKKLAKEWLYKHQTHPKHWEALQRFFLIRRALRQKQGKDLGLRKEFDWYVKKSPQFKQWLFNECLRLEYTCPDCSKYMDGDRFATTDHIIELSEGGTNEFSNFRVICNICNSVKDLKKRGFSANEIYNKLLQPKKIKKLKKAIVVTEPTTKEKDGKLSRIVWDTLFVQ